MPAYRTRDASARTLEVSTDALPPPMVSIISPTPRAFTFPIHDTRYSTSSRPVSPFEPHLKTIPSTPPPLRPFSPTSSIGSDSSHSASVLSSPTAPPSSQASSHRRRRSTASDIGERRPKKGDDDYIKRPENAFILFRRKKCEERQAAQEEDDSGASGPVKKQRQADLSKTISQQWKSLSGEERQYWEDLAKEKKKEHEAMYPNYVYRPQRSKDKKNRKAKGRHGELDTDTESSFSFLVPVSSAASRSRSLSRDYLPVHHQHQHGHGHTHGRRAASAPTPPPAYQSIQLPQVWMPSSPHHVPRISGRSPAPMAHILPPTESAPMMSFDYAPNDQIFMSSYQPHATFDGGDLQQPQEVYSQNMFELSTPENAAMGGPLLHALTIPTREPSTMSPADTIASSLVSPTDTYASPTSTSASSQGGPFTPADALRMLSLVHQQKDVPEGVDAEAEAGAGELQLPYGFWPTDTLWANMDSLLPEDFNLNAIPPVELGLAQFEAAAPAPAPMDGVGADIGFWPGREIEYEPYPDEMQMQQTSPGIEFKLYPEDGLMPSAEEHDREERQQQQQQAGDGYSPGMYELASTTHDTNMNW